MKEAYAASANSPNRSNIVRDTIPQRIVNEWLNEMNYAYTNEELFNSFQVDNYLVDYNLAIEVMGDYWHSNPLVFPDIKQGDPLKRIERDQTKRRVLLMEHGISTLYLWESDIKNREEVCRALIRMFVENKGCLANYNSFNYSCESGFLKLKEPVITAFFEYPMQEIIQMIA